MVAGALQDVIPLQLQSAPVFRTRVEWFSGIAMYHGRAAARLNNIGNLAIVA